MSASNNNILKKLTGSVVVIIILSVCLTITTFALATSLTISGNLTISMGNIGVRFVDDEGKETTDPIVEIDALGLGDTITRDFQIQNTSSAAIYYILYFENVQGEMAKLIDVTITHDDTVLFEGKLADITEEYAKRTVGTVASEIAMQVAEGVPVEQIKVNPYRLEPATEDGERTGVLPLRATFHLAEGSDLTGISIGELTFDISVKAVQEANNEFAEFDEPETSASETSATEPSQTELAQPNN